MKKLITALIVALSGSFSIAHSADDAYVEPPLTEKDRQHWAFQPIRRDLDGDIDAFLLKKLKAVGIDDFAPQADATTLLRRLHFDLTGLPPTPGELATFSIDDIDTKIDALLASPHYGEHWAQHWLDVARFAETDGFEHDKTRPDAWRYRDWVIDALNRDLAYDEFVARQIAGDEMASDDPNASRATGFLFAGPDMPDINLEAERRHNVLNEVTSTVSSAFLGLTIGCAQCHDHKSDPVSQADFYRLRAFFDNAQLPAKNNSLPDHFPERGAQVTTPSVLRIRGDFRRDGPELQPGFVRVINPADSSPDITAKKNSSGRRLALANWLRDQQNPLLARVIVNRVWLQHFGEGLVSTPNDFGLLGASPSHPELLDWLAADFIAGGWSLKQLHRTILRSRAWQQASRQTDGDAQWSERLTADADNRLLSRRSRTRLSGEAIRDAMLDISGRLNPKSGGPGFRPPLPEEVTVTLLKNQWQVSQDEREHYRRSVYLFARRNLRYPLFEIFDRPDANASCARRHLSTTAPQSLMLLNSEFSDARSRDLAERLATQSSVTGRIDLAFQLILNRAPTSDEAQRSSTFIEQASLEAFALAMFNLNEFVFVD